jgi:hypothetical protein
MVRSSEVRMVKRVKVSQGVERNKGTILHPGFVERWNRKMSTTTTNGDIQS